MFFLGDYTVIPVMVMSILLFLMVLTFSVDGDEKGFIRVRIVWTIWAIMLVISILGSYYFYHSTKAEIKKNFLENRVILCEYKKDNIIIKKDANYTLEDDYFIKNGIAIDMDNCKSLEHTDE